MLSFTWHLLKAFRYLLPYLNEVSDERYCEDDSDRLKAKRIRELIRMVLWRLIFFVSFAVLIFWVVVPLHTRNAVLVQELTNRDNKITTLQTELRDLRGDFKKIDKETERYRLSYENKVLEVDRLSEALSECKDFRNKLLAMDKTNEQLAKTINNNNKPSKPDNKSIKYATEDMKNKIKKYNEK